MLRCYSCGCGWNAASSVCLVAQLCLTFCNPVECSPPGSSARGILQERILEWVVMPSSRWSSQSRDGTQASHQGNPRILEWVASLSPGDLPNPGIELGSPELQADSLPAELQGEPTNTGRGSLFIPSPVDLPNPGIELGSPTLHADSLPSELNGKAGIQTMVIRNQSSLCEPINKNCLSLNSES